MTKRLQLGEKLHAILKENGYQDNVYFQSPTTVQMSYPCIRYSRQNIPAKYADDIRYIEKDHYTLTVIDPNPDSQIPDILLKSFRMISLDRPYIADNLNHFVLTLYF